MSTTTFHHAGTLGGPDGELSVSFMPEYNTVFLNASVPSDRRRAPISIRLTDTASLREILDKLEALIELEAQKRRAASQQGQAVVQESEDAVSVLVSGSAISIPRPLYQEAAALVTEGKALIAASLLSKSISWLGVAGARELVQAIYECQRSGGLRE